MNEQAPLIEQIADQHNTMRKREAIQWWRKNVPADVRNIWMRRFAVEHGTNKFLTEFPAFRSMIEQTLPPELKKEYFELLHNIPTEQWRRADEPASQEDPQATQGTENNIHALQEFLEASLPQRATEEFARQYFLSFDNDKDRGAIFFERQRNSVKMVADLLRTLDTQALRKVMQLSQSFPLTLSRSLYDYPEDTFKLQNFSDALAAIVVYGSSAIGPRKPVEEHSYPSAQDLNLLVLPKDPQRLDVTLNAASCALIEYLGALINIIKSGISPNSYPLHEIKAQAIRAIPMLRQLIDRCQMPVDLRAPLPRNFQGGHDDWKMLTGPHRVAGTLEYEWRQSYRYYLQQSVSSARGEYTGI